MSAEQAHSPAPWYDDGYRIYAAVHEDGSPLLEGEDRRNGRCIVEYKYGDQFNPADASLMTTAPRLISALRELVACHAEGGFIEPDADVLQEARAAIAAASGEQPQK